MLLHYSESENESLLEQKIKICFRQKFAAARCDVVIFNAKGLSERLKGFKHFIPFSESHARSIRIPNSSICLTYIFSCRTLPNRSRLVESFDLLAKR